MKTALFQYDPSWENKEENRNKIHYLMDRYYRGSDLLIFPEMTLTGFTMNTGSMAEPLQGETHEFFTISAKNYFTDIIAGFIEISDEGNFYNTLLHISRTGETKAVYRKIHPFSLSGEDKYYTPGGGTVLSGIDGAGIGLSICYDLRFPELFRQYVKEKAELIVNIANWPVPRIEHYRTLLKARAIENLCYAAGVNRVGSDINVAYNGFSSVFSPLGEEIISVQNKEGIFSADLDFESVKLVRKKFSFLEDIRLI